jgi:large subunit ribosomal protein L24
MVKKEWSKLWIKSVQPRKQRKYRYNAPLHVRHKFISANLAPELRRRFEKRSMPVRKGDEVEVMRGSSVGLRGTVSRIDLKTCRVYVEEIKVKKVDGSEIMKPLQPSNLRILKLGLDDKMRQKVIDRAEQKRKKPGKPEAEVAEEKRKPKETKPKKHEKPAGRKKQPEKKAERKPRKVKKKVEK